VNGLNGRVRALERQERLADGCRACQGRLVGGVTGAHDDEYPPWVDVRGRCRGCGTAIKCYPQWMLDRLP
jgi:hypothetical protein